MGLRIFCNERKPIPRPVRLELACDGKNCSAVDLFKRYNHIANWAAAMKAGWLERYIGKRPYRIFLCPKCSGKKRLT